MLPPERWPDVERLFLAASEPGADIERCVRGVDAGVAAEVRALLAAAADADAFFGRPALLALLAADDSDVLPPGTPVGVWTVDEEVGRGGMGLVYRAHRADGAYDQTVALKVVHASGPAAEAAERFLRERALLASLRHAHIARLLDGGTLPDGQPYLAMEFVEGVPVTEYAEAERLPLHCRLGLLLDVCAAVAHAHRRLVVHCDIKPGNVLVEVADDGRPVIKLLDFGIAQALGLGTPGAPVGDVRYTPRYAAPEQVRGGAVGTATDVFALGVLLADLAGIVRGGDAAGETARATAAGKAGPGEDLAAIVARATEADPEQRYPSVDAFADDLRRHLDGRPVRARPRTPLYVASRFLRRHRWQVAAAVAFLAMLVAGSGIILRQSRRIAHERDVSGNVASLLEDLFLQVDPGGNVTGASSVRGLLDTGAAQAALVPDPETKARLFDVLGRVYRALAVYDHALPMQRDAVRLYTQTRGPRDAETLRATHHLAYLLEQMGRTDEAEGLYLRVLAERRRTGTPTDMVESLSDLATLYVQHDQPEAARRLVEEGLAVMDRHPDAGPEGLAGPLARASFLLLLGDLDYVQKRPGHGVGPMREAARLYARERGAAHPFTAAAQTHLASALLREHAFAEAERLSGDSERTQEKAWGPMHPWTLAALDTRVRVYLAAAPTQALPGSADSARRILTRLDARVRTTGDSARMQSVRRLRVRADSVLVAGAAPPPRTVLHR